MSTLCSRWHQWHCIPQFSFWTQISTFSLKQRTIFIITSSIAECWLIYVKGQIKFTWVRFCLRPSCWQFSKDWIESDIGAWSHCSVSTSRGWLKPSQAQPCQDKTGNCNQANSIPWQWQCPVQVASLPPSPLHQFSSNTELGTLYTCLTLGRSHNLCTSDIL